MSLPQMAPITQEEYDRWFWTTELRTEFKDGQVIVLSPENADDERLRWFLGAVILHFVEEHELGQLYGPNLQIRPREGLRRVPDLLFIAKPNMARLTSTYLQGGPDLALEVVSSGSTRRDRVEKFAEYREAGVREYWIVDPRKRKLDVYVLERDDVGKVQYVPLPAVDGVQSSRVLPGFWIRVEWLWQDPPPRINAVQRELGLL